MEDRLINEYPCAEAACQWTPVAAGNCKGWGGEEAVGFLEVSAWALWEMGC